VEQQKHVQLLLVLIEHVLLLHTVYEKSNYYFEKYDFNFSKMKGMVDILFLLHHQF